MAKRKRKTRRKQQRPPLPGWIWMLFGLGIGLALAFAIYERQSVSQPAAPKAQAASVIEDQRDTAETVVARELPERKPEYDFYEELPSFEVVVPEGDLNMRQERKPAEVQQTGIYEVQAGSFARLEDADRQRAQLALLGFESRIQSVNVNNRTMHRVRIGPIDDTTRLNDIRARLYKAKIDNTTFRVGG